MFIQRVTYIALALGISFFGASCQRESEEPGFDGRRISQVDIRFVGTQRVDEARLRNFIKVTPEQSYSTEVIDEDIKSLYGSGLVDDVRALVEPQGEDLILTYEVTTGLRFGPSPIRIVGNTVFSRVELAKVTKLRSIGNLTPEQMEEACIRLEHFYSHNGYSEAKVTSRLDDEEDFQQFIFIIDEGPKTTD